MPTVAVVVLVIVAAGVAHEVKLPVWRGDDPSMSSNLIQAGSGSSVDNPYGLQTYHQQADYQTVVNVFNILSHNEAINHSAS